MSGKEPAGGLFEQHVWFFMGKFDLETVND